MRKTSDRPTRAAARSLHSAGAASTARVLERDPELGEGLDPARFAAALARSQAGTLRIPRGPWVPPASWPAKIREGPGLLVLDGLMLRRVVVDDRASGELLAAGDIMRPWQREDSGASVPRRPAWHALERVQIAVLDTDFARRMAQFPEIGTQFVARALRRSRQLAMNVAIVHQPRVEVRVLLMLWQLADRFGTVRHDGALLPVRLTHTLIAELVAARRPTVSAALAALERAGAVTREPGGAWLLRGRPSLGAVSGP